MTSITNTTAAAITLNQVSAAIDAHASRIELGWQAYHWAKVYDEFTGCISPEAAGLATADDAGVWVSSVLEFIAENSPLPGDEFYDAEAVQPVYSDYQITDAECLALWQLAHLNWAYRQLSWEADDELVEVPAATYAAVLSALAQD